MAAAELLTADPLAGRRAVACGLLTKQRPLPDDVDGWQASVPKAQPEIAPHRAAGDLGVSQTLLRKQ
jgi:hypothetical protein